MKNFTKHFVYWILPLLIMLPCIYIYFFNPFGLSWLIAPVINREFGVIENLQLALLAGIFLFAVKGFRRKKLKAEKYAYMLLGTAAVFCFLEEIDYGLHYYEYLAGITKEEVEYHILVQHCPILSCPITKALTVRSEEHTSELQSPI